MAKLFKLLGISTFDIVGQEKLAFCLMVGNGWVCNTNLLKGLLFSLNFAFCSWDFSGFFDGCFFFVPRVFLLNDQLIIWWVFLLSSWKNMTHDSELITREQIP